MAALELSKSRDAEYGAASALAVAGDASSSQPRGRFGTALPGGHICQIHYLPTLRALLALRRGGPSMAIELFEDRFAIRSGPIGHLLWTSSGTCIRLYVRGEAYLAANQAATTAAEFQKILDHLSIIFADPGGTVARWLGVRSLRRAIASMQGMPTRIS